MSRKPFKITGSDRTALVGICAASISEVIHKARDVFAIESDNLHLVLEEDGTEFIEDDYLMMLDNNTKLMILCKDEKWNPPVLARDEIDSRQTLNKPVQILEKLSKSPGSIALLSEEDLEDVVGVSFDQIAHAGISEDNFICLQDACYAEMERKQKLKDALDMIDLFKKANGNKEP